VTNLNLAIFKHAATEGIGAKAASLFPGIGFGAAYKILQRVYKFGGQPVVLDIMTKRFGSDFDDTFGKKLGRTLMSATSGSIIGVGESKSIIEMNECKAILFVFRLVQKDCIANTHYYLLIYFFIPHTMYKQQ
jgi:hypothetical protein